MSIGQRLILGFIAIALLVDVVGYIAFTKITKVGVTFDRVEEETTPAILALGEIKANWCLLLSKADGYILEPAARHLAEFAKAKEQLGRAILAYEKAEAGEEDEEEEEIEQIKEGTAKIIALGEEIIKLKDGGASHDVLLEKSRELDRAAKVFIHELDEEIEHDTAQLKESGVNVNKEIRNTLNLTFVLTLGALFLAIGLGIFISHSISNPITKLKNATVEIAKGNLGTKIDTRSKNEIGILANSFNKMAKDLSVLMQKEIELSAKTAVADAERKRAKELEKAYKDLQEAQEMLVQVEKLNAVGQLASGVAHEVRNPLGIIIQGINYLERKIPTKGAGVSETLTMVKDSVKRADKIITLLLDFSKSSQVELQPEDINSVLENSLTLVKARYEFRHIDVVKETKKDIPKVLIDRNRIEQVFVNIFLNAIQAMPKGGKFIIRSYDKQLAEVKNGIGRRKEDHFSLGEHAVIVEIEDTGSGISEGNLKKIFDPFFTTKGPSGGTGLGLSVTQNIIHMHKGLIDVKSQMGKGTKVIITFKIAGGRQNGQKKNIID